MSEKIVYQRPSGLFDGAVSSFCPGCLHSATMKVIMEVLDEMDKVEETCWIQGVGCGSLGPYYMDIDQVSAPHGRACAMASAYKACAPDTLTFTYQGDGDLAAIGLGETISAANRGDNFAVIFINNGIYGMTGGQMAPTTPVGVKTTTTPYGRTMEEHGHAMDMCKLIDALEAPVYIARVSCCDIANIKKAKAAVKKAFQYQLEGKGFCFIEFVSNCPTNWGLSPLKSIEYLKEKMLAEFPLGEFRDR